MFSRSGKKAKTTGEKVSGTTTTTTAAVAAPLVLVSEIDKKKKELEEAEGEVKKWSEKVEIALSNWEKETNPKKEAKAKQIWEAVKEERDRFSAQVVRLTAEIAAVSSSTTVVLVNVPPSVDELLGLKYPPFNLRNIDLTGPPPVGPDAAADMRFFPAERPAAQTILGKLQKLSDRNQVTEMMLIAVSGAGKTSTIFQAAREVFTLYIPCTPAAVHAQPTRHARDKSGSFLELEAAVNRTVPLKKTPQEKTDEAKRLSVIFLVAHYFLLLLFLKRFPSATPLQFLLFQLTGAEGRNITEMIFSRLAPLSVDAAQDLARATRNDLLPLLTSSSPKSHVLLAIDEMEGAAKLDTQYLSRNGKSGRSLLSPFLQAASTLRTVAAVSILVCGTGSSQDRYESVTSDIGKQDIEQILASGFPLATRVDVDRVLLSIPGVTREMIDALPNLGYLVDARYRLVARTVEIFMQCTTEPDTEVRLRESVDTSVKQHKEKLMASLKEQVDTDSTANNTSRLKQIHAVYVASKLSNGRMDFTTSDLDLCRIGLGALMEKDVFRVSERFALGVIEDFFKANPKLDASIWFRQSVTDLQDVIRARGIAVTAKGELFENVVFHALRRACFQGKSVTELGFVSKLENVEEEERKQKEWQSVIFKCTGVQVLPHGATDPEFVLENPYVMLSPQEYHRADGIMNLPVDHLVEVGIKLYSSNVPTALVESQFRATNPDKAYGHAKLDRPNQVHAGLRLKWDELGLHKRKTLRVHVIIPKSAEPQDVDDRIHNIYYPGTYLLEDDSIVVNIDMSTIHLLFGNPADGEEKKLFDAITRLLEVVNPSA